MGLPDESGFNVEVVEMTNDAMGVSTLDELSIYTVCVSSNAMDKMDKYKMLKFLKNKFKNKNHLQL